MKLKFVFALALGLNTAVWCQSPAGLHTLKTAGIVYHGGPVLGTTATPSVYYIWYGNWTGNTGVQILTDLANHLGGSGYYNITTTYTDSNDASVVNALHYGGSTVDHYSLGRRLSQAMLEKIVSNAITSAALPSDTNAVYMVLTSADVLVAGFCTKSCGFHQHFELNGAAIKYAFVGNPAAQCLAGCAGQTVGPNGNAGADAMVSSLVHELEESVTDPLGNGWYFANGDESADRCAWKFGTTYAAINGAKANVSLGTRDFLIQENWVAPNGGCALTH